MKKYLFKSFWFVGILLTSVRYKEPKKRVQINVADVATGLYFIEVSNGGHNPTGILRITR